jgi:hypothetical protein
MSHLERVRGQAPPKRAPRRVFVTATTIALVAGAASGLSLARGSDWLVSVAPLAGVSVVGANHLDARDVAVAAGIDPAAERVDDVLDEVERRLEGHAWIAAASAMRLPGGRLLLEVEERVPAAVIEDGSGRHSFSDVSGTTFADAPAEADPTLPRIVTPEPPTPLEPDAEIARAIRIAHDLPALGLGPAIEIRLAAPEDPTGITLRLEGVSPRIVLGRDDLDSKLKELARLLTAGVPEVSQADELDLRFADQAVLRNESLPEGAAQSGDEARMRGVVHNSDRPGDPAV